MDNIDLTKQITALHKDRRDWNRRAAILSRVWYLSSQEREELDTHSLYRATLGTFLQKMFQSEEDHCLDKIEIGVVTYTISYLNCSSVELIEAGDGIELADIQLLLSCRVVQRRNFAIALVQPRYRGMSEEKWNSVRWLSS